MYMQTYMIYIKQNMYLYIYVCVHVYVYVYVVYMYTCLCIYIYLYTYIFVASGDLTDRSHGKSPSPIGKAAINRLFNIDFP